MLFGIFLVVDEYLNVFAGHTRVGEGMPQGSRIPAAAAWSRYVICFKPLEDLAQ